MIEFFESPEMAEAAQQAERWDWLHFGYARRIEALKRGMMYFSQQANLPENERFASPPDVTPLRLQIQDRSDDGLSDATLTLLLEFKVGL